jgi:glycosyltransferase involved in cell wall biosynthesis
MHWANTVSTHPPKLVIVDQSLRDHDGHHCEYAQSIAHAALAMGLLPIVAANRSCDGQVAALFPHLRRHFSSSWNEIHLSRRDRAMRRVLAHLPPYPRSVLISTGSALKRIADLPQQKRSQSQTLPMFGREIAELIIAEGLSRRDHILVHTLSIAELHAMIDATTHLSDPPTLHILLRRDADEPSVKEDAWGGIGGAFASLNDLAPLKERLRFYSDTKQLCQQYEAISPGITVHLLPIPHGLPEQVLSFRDHARVPVCFTYLGNARTEKGFHHLPDAVDQLHSSHLKTGRICFVIQANSNMSLEDLIITEARRRLARYPRNHVELLLHSLAIPEFQRRLGRADVILLPYLAERYRRRSSGILIQALVCGKPVVVPRNSWLADETPSAAAVVFDGPNDLSRAIADATDRVANLQSSAHQAASAWRSCHNPERLLRVLLNSTTLQGASSSAVP